MYVGSAVQEPAQISQIRKYVSVESKDSPTGEQLPWVPHPADITLSNQYLQQMSLPVQLQTKPHKEVATAEAPPGHFGNVPPDSKKKASVLRSPQKSLVHRRKNSRPGPRQRAPALKKLDTVEWSRTHPPNNAFHGFENTSAPQVPQQPLPDFVEWMNGEMDIRTETPLDMDPNYHSFSAAQIPQRPEQQPAFIEGMNGEMDIRPKTPIHMDSSHHRFLASQIPQRPRQQPVFIEGMGEEMVIRMKPHMEMDPSNWSFLATQIPGQQRQPGFIEGMSDEIGIGPKTRMHMHPTHQSILASQVPQQPQHSTYEAPAPLYVSPAFQGNQIVHIPTQMNHMQHLQPNQNQQQPFQTFNDVFANQAAQQQQIPQKPASISYRDLYHQMSEAERMQYELHAPKLSPIFQEIRQEILDGRPPARYPPPQRFKWNDRQLPSRQYEGFREVQAQEFHPYREENREQQAFQEEMDEESLFMEYIPNQGENIGPQNPSQEMGQYQMFDRNIPIQGRNMGPQGPSPEMDNHHMFDKNMLNQGGNREQWHPSQNNALWQGMGMGFPSQGGYMDPPDPFSQ